MVAEPFTFAYDQAPNPRLPDIETSLTEPYEVISKTAKAKRAQDERREREFREKLQAPARGQAPQLIWIRAGDVKFDDRYQVSARRDWGRVRRIAADWDWNRPHLAITINRRPEEGDTARGAWCPDGWHRTQAVIMRFGEDQRMPAELHGVPYEQEAEMFRIQDEGSKKVAEAFKFNAGLESRHAASLEAQAVASRLRIYLKQKAGYRTVATKTFLEVFRAHGSDAVETAFRILLDRFEGDSDSMEAPIVKGFCEFVARNHRHPNYAERNLTEHLATYSIVRIEEAAGKVGKPMPGHKKIAAALVDIYNFQRRNKLRAWWES